MSMDPAADLGPRAQACIAWARGFMGRFAQSPDPFPGTSGYVHGIMMGVALAQIDPEWATAAAQELGQPFTDAGIADILEMYRKAARHLRDGLPPPATWESQD